MDQSSSPDYKELFERETKLRRQAEEERQQAEEERRHAEERNRQFTRKTSLLEYLRTCHNLLSCPLHVRTPSRSTKGKIPAPQGKYCPARLLPWTDCAAAQQEIYESVCSYLQTTSDHPPQLFSTVARLEGVARHRFRPTEAWLKYYHVKLLAIALWASRINVCTRKKYRTLRITALTRGWR